MTLNFFTLFIFLPLDLSLFLAFLFFSSYSQLSGLFLIELNLFSPSWTLSGTTFSLSLSLLIVLLFLFLFLFPYSSLSLSLFLSFFLSMLISFFHDFSVVSLFLFISSYFWCYNAWPTAVCPTDNQSKDSLTLWRSNNDSQTCGCLGQAPKGPVKPLTPLFTPLIQFSHK